MNRNRKRLLLALAFFLATFGLVRAPAHASCGATVPYIFINLTSIVDAVSTNANNAFLLGCASTIDNTQIGPNGIYASQIIPTNTSQANFGGSVDYTFPQNLFLTGGFLNVGPGCGNPPNAGDGTFCRSSSTGKVVIGGQFLDYNLLHANSFSLNAPLNVFSNGANSWVAPIYQVNGQPYTVTVHEAVGTYSSTLASNCSAGFMCALTSSSTIPFGGSAQFADTSYKCFLTPNYGTGGQALLFTAGYHGKTTTQFVIDVMSGPQGLNTSVGTISVDYDCKGN